MAIVVRKGKWMEQDFEIFLLVVPGSGWLVGAYMFVNAVAKQEKILVQGNVLKNKQYFNIELVLRHSIILILTVYTLFALVSRKSELLLQYKSVLYLNAILPILKSFWTSNIETVTNIRRQVLIAYFFITQYFPLFLMYMELTFE